MKVIWTFDPFEKNKPLRLFGKKLLSNLFSKSDKVEAVYIASHSEVALTTAFDVPKKDRFNAYPKKLIRAQLNTLNLKKVVAKAIPEAGMSLSASIKKLTAYARASHADLIVASTHGKVGLPRLIFGSFAESLVLASEVDLLLYNQKTKLSRAPKKLVYAHDFTKQSALGLVKIADYAHKWNATITVVHIPGSSNSKSADADLILKAAKKANADLIAVTSASGKVSILLSGSITRSIMRKSTVPTLVLKV